MHALPDSSLLWEAVRVMVLLLKQSYQGDGDGSAPMSSKRLPLGAFGYPRGSHVATRLSAKLTFCTQLSNQRHFSPKEFPPCRLMAKTLLIDRGAPQKPARDSHQAQFHFSLSIVRLIRRRSIRTLQGE